MIDLNTLSPGDLIMIDLNDALYVPFRGDIVEVALKNTLGMFIGIEPDEAGNNDDTFIIAIVHGRVVAVSEEGCVSYSQTYDPDQ